MPSVANLIYTMTKHYEVYYRRFQVTFQRAVAKFVANLPITFRNLEVRRELRSRIQFQLPRFNFAY